MQGYRFVYLGPTCHENDIAKHGLKDPHFFINDLDSFDGRCFPDNSMIFLPPIKCGDLVTLKKMFRNFSVGVIDGYFENILSVWHKEIMDLLSSNVPVYGAASMGALRASELRKFGMIGVGEIYESFVDGTYEDDDEVAVVHGPAELGYPKISEAMVNIRASIRVALKDQIVSDVLAVCLIKSAKSLFYKDRNYKNILKIVRQISTLESEIERFELWIENNAIDQKKIDALRLINAIQDGQLCLHPVEPFVFQDSMIWRNFISIDS